MPSVTARRTPRAPPSAAPPAPRVKFSRLRIRALTPRAAVPDRRDPDTHSHPDAQSTPSSFYNLLHPHFKPGQVGQTVRGLESRAVAHWSPRLAGAAPRPASENRATTPRKCMPLPRTRRRHLSPDFTCSRCNPYRMHTFQSSSISCAPTSQAGAAAERACAHPLSAARDGTLRPRRRNEHSTLPRPRNGRTFPQSPTLRYGT